MALFFFFFAIDTALIIEINRFFRDPIGDETGNWTEISEEEYMQRKENKIEKL